MGAVAQGFTILIVEDHAVIAAEIADGIQRNGGQVLGPASRLPEALALIQTTPCDAALLDVNLGHEAVYPAAEKLQIRGVPFAFLTGSDDEEIDSRYADIVLLRKPFGEVQLEGCLRKLLGLSVQSEEKGAVGLTAADVVADYGPRR